MTDILERGSNYRTIHELSEDERPRERLLRHRPSVLSDTELIAIVLGSGSQGENVVDLARRILDEAGGLAGLVQGDANVLQRTKGMGPAKAAQIGAAIELGRRAQQVNPQSRPTITSPEDVFGLMGGRFLGKTKEEMVVLSLDTKAKLLGSATAMTGTVRSVSMRVGELFKEPVVLDATAVIITHNHPSGDPKPSTMDIKLTRQIMDAGKVLGIDVKDHVVIGQQSFVSLRRQGHMAE